MGMLLLWTFLPIVIATIALAIFFVVQSIRQERGRTAMACAFSLVMIASPVWLASWIDPTDQKQLPPEDRNPFFLIETGAFASALLALLVLTIVTAWRRHFGKLVPVSTLLASLLYMRFVRGGWQVENQTIAVLIPMWLSIAAIAFYPMLWVLLVRECAVLIDSHTTRSRKGSAMPRET